MDVNQVADEFKHQATNLLDQSTIKIHHCLSQLDNTEIWWRPNPQINSIGNLILHVCGNLKQWTTAAFSNAQDTRDRQSEFTQSASLSKAELLGLISETVERAKQIIHDVDSDLLLRETEIQGFQVNVMEALLHTTAHFLGHTHQIIMLTRMIKKEHYRFQWTPDMERDILPM